MFQKKKENEVESIFIVIAYLCPIIGTYVFLTYDEEFFYYLSFFLYFFLMFCISSYYSNNENEIEKTNSKITILSSK